MTEDELLNEKIRIQARLIEINNELLALGQAKVVLLEEAVDSHDGHPPDVQWYREQDADWAHKAKGESHG